MAGFRVRAFAAIAAGVLAAGTAARAAEENTILAIYAETRLVPVVATIDDAIRSTLQSRSSVPVRFHTEYLDLSWFTGIGADELLARLLKEKYAGRKIDVVIPCGDAALRFALRERDALFPGIPIVFCTADREAIDEAALGPDVTGVTIFLDWAGTAELALRLHPGTRRIVFIGGSGPTAREWERTARQALSSFENRVQVDYLTELSMADVLKSVAALPEGTIGIFSAFLRDANGKTFTTPEALDVVASVSKIPIYSTGETLLGHGIVGGPMIDFAAQGKKAAELAKRIVEGERLGRADIVRENVNTYMFDARQLERWGISDDRLPPGSVVRFRQPSTWQAYKWHLVAAIGLIALQSSLIVGLLLHRRQRRRAERRLDERLRFETLISDLAADLIQIEVEEFDRKIDQGLRRVVEELAVDRASIVEFAAGHLRVAYSSNRADVPSLPPVLEITRVPWIADRLRTGRVVCWSLPGELPPEAAVDRTTVEALGIKSIVLVPTVFAREGRRILLACSVLREQRKWSDDLVQRLRVLGEIFAIVLLRRRAQRALEESEGRFRLMADAAPVMIWMAGPDGACIDFNRAWLEFTGRTLEQERGDGWLEGVHPGDREACGTRYREALEARRTFTLEYRLRRADGAYRSVLDRGVPRFGGDPPVFSGYVGSAVDITEVREAHQEVERGREDLAHALRVATLGELTATLAHEINQPLGGIASNAQALRRLLSGPLAPRREDLEEALHDIEEDARRGSDIIRRLRALFRKEQPNRQPVDVNDAIVEVTSLLRKELERKRVALRLDLTKKLPPVLGDVVQLQQVLLNVVVNACDAMNGNDGAPRELRIETAQGQPGRIIIAFRDSGTGVAQADLHRIFDRFVTTKPEGLGMGLSICRSIIEAHGGRIWATRNDDRGLTIHSDLPCLNA
ncbi:MAG: ABC transporter substrate binding protein [Myxococcales bacterium]